MRTPRKQCWLPLQAPGRMPGLMTTLQTSADPYFDPVGKRLLISGGTGSFGNTVLKRFLGAGIGEVRIFSRDEKKQEDMRLQFQDDRVKFLIGDVRDLRSISNAMRDVDLVFHAAALKQVPSCEFYPMEAVRTNILGAENVIEAAIEAGVGRVVMLSTDKAVYPINAMGMSKALMEKVTAAKARSLGAKAQTVLCTTRYGNVMGSRGSVIPLFVEQVLSGQSITITDPSMTRFLMSLEQSVDLVMHAYTHAQQGDVFVKRAPACTIKTLADAIMQVMGRRVPINVIGTRHGEKRHETLVSREEMIKAELGGGYYRIPQDLRDLNYRKYFVEGDAQITTADDYSSNTTDLLDVNSVADTLRDLTFIKQACGERDARSAVS
jgi:UDP-N-acetylglucosamine 4,6-dehydratase/5-epimerase